MAGKKRARKVAPRQDAFWSLIDAYRDGDDYDLDGLSDALAASSKEEILAFGTRFDAHMQASYRGDLWGAAYLANGGCSDDGFDYFRGWLISRGRAVFEAALENPDSLVAAVGEGDVELSGILYVAPRAWEARTGKDHDDYYAQLGDAKDVEELDLAWSEDGDGVPERLKKAYPKLYAKFGDDL